jgi:tripartite-type tricarboxylate transporter receptor subunit TctC
MKKLAQFLAAAVMAFCAAAAQAAYPDHTVRIIVPFPPGGPTDVQARIVAQKLSERLGQTFIVENRPGAGGNIGTRAAAQTPGDGYTLLFMTPAQVINMKFYSNPGYDLKTNFVPIGLISTAPALLLAHPSLGATTVADVIRIAKAKPGAIAYASAGAGLSTHLMMESLKKTAGINMIHVPYRGSAPALQGLIAGDTSLLMDSVVSGLPHVRSGALRAIAVSSAKRTPIAPEIPTLAESGLPGFDAITWYGVMAPAKTPPEIVRQLASEIGQILGAPDIRKRFLEMGSEPAEVNPESFGRFLDAEARRWLEVVRESGAKMDE